MAYGDGLENRCRRKTTVGSNPTSSADRPESTFLILHPPGLSLPLGVSLKVNNAGFVSAASYFLRN